MADDNEPDGAAVAKWLTGKAATIAATLGAIAAIGGAIGWAASNVWEWHDSRLELLLLTEADHALIDALSRHADTRAATICAEQIEALGLDERLAELRGDVEASMDTPPTIADISRRQRADGSRLIRLEALHEVGVARAIAERAREEAALRAGRHEP